MSLNQSPEVVRIANTLGIYQHPRPVEAIVEYCLGRVTEWIKEMGSVDSLAQVERIVCAKLRLKFEYVQSDADLERIRAVYTAKGEAIIKSVLEELDEKTFGALFQRRHATARDRDLYVAVIDCRGDKLARKFFTKWHEIAHLLTLKHQLELVLNRTGGLKKPEEQLMDVIAGRVGFYPTIFQRAFNAELEAYGRFSFGFVQRVRDNVSPEASYEATLHACLESFPQPCLLVRAAMGLTQAEHEQVTAEQQRLFPEAMPVPTLRAVSVHGNSAARDVGLRIHRNMRIPDDSHIYRAFQELDRPSDDLPRHETLSIWRHSDGRGLSSREVTIYTRPHGNVLLALIVNGHDYCAKQA